MGCRKVFPAVTSGQNDGKRGVAWQWKTWCRGTSTAQKSSKPTEKQEAKAVAEMGRVVAVAKRKAKYLEPEYERRAGLQDGSRRGP